MSGAAVAPDDTSGSAAAVDVPPAAPHHWMAMGNRAPIAACMATLVQPGSDEAQGLALEIGSGTGAQLEALAEIYTGLSWRPSEYCPGRSVVRGFYEQGPDGPDAGHPVEKMRGLADLDTALGGRGNVLPAVELDGSQRFEAWGAAVTASGEGSYALVFCSNVVHISPWSVAEGICAGAGRALRTGGSLVFHGPFKLDGQCVGLGHEQLWDEQMRACGRGWGIRDISEVEAEALKSGLKLVATCRDIGPGKNWILRFVKQQM
jgi:SAM-dependent methyltransferase